MRIFTMYAAASSLSRPLTHAKIIRLRGVRAQQLQIDTWGAQASLDERTSLFHLHRPGPADNKPYGPHGNTCTTHRTIVNSFVAYLSASYNSIPVGWECVEALCNEIENMIPADLQGGAGGSNH
jgi:hypothetical protein